MPSIQELEATVSGGPYDGYPIYTWAEHVFLSQTTTRLVAQSVAVVLGLWEFISFFPAEVVLWRRISKKGRPGRANFAPWTTLALRYIMLWYVVSTGFQDWSTTMASVAACKATSGFNIAAGDLLNAVVAFAIAWRAQAVARGVIQNRSTIRWMQFLIALLVAAQVFVIIFAVTWPSVRDTFWRSFVHYGRCESLRPLINVDGPYPVVPYASDPLLWFYVVTVFFNLVCLIIVLVALRSLACRSRGFSKFITAMRNHSLFFFIIILVLSTLGIVWRAIQQVPYICPPIAVIEASVMIRILLAEQDAARRPMDTTYLDNNYAAGTSRYQSGGVVGGGGGTRGQLPSQYTLPRVDTTIQFADQMQSNQDYQQYRLHLLQQQQQQQQNQPGQNQQQQHQVEMPRPIYQPFSIMDNLGQAFSQVDSRNPQDLDGQSLDLSDGGSIIGGPIQNVYPGVVQQEMERQRQMALEKELQMKMMGSSSEMRSHDQGQSTNTSEQSNELTRDGKVSSSSDVVVGEEGKREEQQQQQQQHRQQPQLSTLGSRLQRSASLHSASDRNYFTQKSRGNNDNDDDDDDEEVGIQTVQF